MTLPSNPGADPGIPSWARKGAKVVCVLSDGLWKQHPIIEGEVYEIDAVGLYSGYSTAAGGRYHGAGVRLKGRPNPNRIDGFFCILRFRPLITQEDDLEAHFNQYLREDHPARLPVELAA